MRHKETISKIGIKAIKSLSDPLFIMLFSACVLTVIVTYQLSLRQLERDVRQMSSEHKPFIENMLWQFDIETIEYQLQGIVDLDSVKQVVVTDSTGRIIEAQDTSSVSSIPVVVVPLTHSNLSGRVEQFGTLSIHASNKGVWALVRRRVLGLIFVYLAATSIVSLLILRQFNRNVLEPIRGIANELRSPPEDLSKFHIDLNRRSAEDDEDELNELVDAKQIKQIDVILSDIIIPGAMDGRALSKQLQLTYPKVRVVYISGFTEDSIVHNGRLDDGVVLLQKPFRLIELARILTEHA